MQKFLQLSKEIFENLPLILSDTDSAKDVSLNRIIIVMAVIGLSCMIIILPVFFPQWFDKLMPFWSQLLTFLGAQIAGNMFKKVMLDKQMKQTTEMINNKANEIINASASINPTLNVNVTPPKITNPIKKD